MAKPTYEIAIVVFKVTDNLGIRKYTEHESYVANVFSNEQRAVEFAEWLVGQVRNGALRKVFDA